jgi:threonine dehydrogenase-like Zn-dependent dehydrogenase
VKQVLIRQGQAVIEEVPAPQVERGTVLVQVSHSCVSIGTEMSAIKTSNLPLWKRALKQPENVKKVVDLALSQGISRTANLVQGKLSNAQPTGYSAAGTVLQVGTGIEDIQVGDRVACAGAQCAHHAEIIRVPRNLTVPIPDNLDFDLASTVTLGAIALQGIRRAQPTLGEVFVVLGLGILGQITAQMLKVNGCKVIGTDLDRQRINIAKQLGMDIGIYPEDGDNIEQVARLTDGIGADGVIITAATPSDEIVSTAFKMCRKKGRVVLVGDVGLNLNRADFYQKELDLFISTSYGPGRYDNNYEEKGLDYPVGYIRWTENRNMAEYLRLVANGQVAVKPLMSPYRQKEKNPSCCCLPIQTSKTVKTLLGLYLIPVLRQQGQTGSE